MIFADGQKVAYVGDPYDEVAIGDVGVVVQAGHTASHVKWVTGAATGSFAEVAHHEITPAQAARVDDIDLLAGSIVDFAVDDTFQRSGARGVMRVLSKRGHLSGLEALALRSVEQFVASVRSDPSFIEVLGDLDEQDGEDLVSLTAVSLLRDALEL